MKVEQMVVEKQKGKKKKKFNREKALQGRKFWMVHNLTVNGYSSGI